MGKKTSTEDIYKVIASWAITGNYAETARELNMSARTVEKLVKENKDKPEFADLFAQKRSEFSALASRIIEKALRRLEKEIDDEERDIPINHLTTAIGTLYDKRALCEGKTTGNVAVEIKLPPGIDEYAG